MSDPLRKCRLARNFHQTFKPERHYIHAMLRFAAAKGEGDYQAIHAATGIPTGASSGKVPAILEYCRGMRLICLMESDRPAVKRPELTPFGRVVLLEDPYLKSSLSQWIAHFNLCSPLTGADVWYHTFFPGTQALGMRFERTNLESHLSAIYGIERVSLIGPLIGMYEDDAAFRACGVLSESSGTVLRKSPPVSDEFGPAYAAWLLQLMSDHFPEAKQVPVTDLDARAGWRTIPGWDIGSCQRVLEIVQQKGFIKVDRQMQPWLIQPAVPVEGIWKRIYEDLL